MADGRDLQEEIRKYDCCGAPINANHYLDCPTRKQPEPTIGSRKESGIVMLEVNQHGRWCATMLTSGYSLNVHIGQDVNGVGVVLDADGTPADVLRELANYLDGQVTQPADQQNQSISTPNAVAGIALGEAEAKQAMVGLNGQNHDPNSYQVGGQHYRRGSLPVTCQRCGAVQPLVIQHWDYVVANNIPYLEAQVIKYLTRWRSKNGAEDVRKAKHFLEKLMAVEGIE